MSKKTKNENCTRAFSDAQEKAVCRLLNATQQPNSGAGMFRKGDCYQKEASLLIEAKCVETDKSSFSIKKEWIEKNRQEALVQRLSNYCIAFNFGPNQENHFVINERLMKFLVDKLIEEEM